MKPRVRLQILTAAGEDPPADAPPTDEPVTDPPAEDDDAPVEPPADTGTGRFHAVLIVETVETGDGRIFAEGSLSWRDLPLPLMAKDTDEHGSFSADTKSTLIGNIDTIEKRGTEVHVWGAYLSQPSEDAARLIGLVQRGELRGISADIDSVEFEILVPVEVGPDGEPLPTGALYDEFGNRVDDGAGPKVEEDESGDTVEVIEMPKNVKMRVTEGRIMGGTVVPFPALQEAFIEDDSAGLALTAAAHPVLAAHHVTGVMLTAAAAGTFTGFEFPDLPESDWFDLAEPDHPVPFTILDNGQVYGHLATWGECHVGIAGECVSPPTSPSNYARFHVGEVPCSDGSRVATGRLTFRTGHADTRLNAEDTRAHYDHTGTVAADIVARDGEHGIWCCGAMRSGLTTAQVREVMSSPPSGDWRRFGRDLELVGALCVNVPGFNTRRDLGLAASAAAPDVTPMIRLRKDEGLVASLILFRPPAAAPAGGAGSSPALDPVLAARLRTRLAAAIGRGPDVRRAELAARVHGGRS
jgi:hypothetical protein